MKRQVNNFGRFYSAFRRLVIHGDRDETKCQLVLQYTGGRTCSLRDVTTAEYRALCEAVERMVQGTDELKKARSLTLLLLQRYGIDTTDWNAINAFCRDQRISGMPFGRLDTDDHKALQRKLRAILRKECINQ